MRPAVAAGTAWGQQGWTWESGVAAKTRVTKDAIHNGLKPLSVVIPIPAEQTSKLVMSALVMAVTIAQK